MCNKSVAIVLVNWNQKDDLIECLTSISKLDYPNHSLIIVDNNSKDGSIKEAKKVYKQRLKIIKNKTNVGFAAANNIGIREALKENFDYIMLLNTDTIIEKDALKNIINFMEEKKQIAALSPLILFYQKKDTIWYAGGIINPNRRQFYHRGAFQVNKGQFDKATEVDFLTGCCLVIKSNIIEQIGMFDERFFMYFEDTDLSFRLRNSGYKIYFYPNAKIWHKAADKKTHDRKVYYHYYMTRNKLYLLKRYLPGILIQEIFYMVSKVFFDILRFKYIRTIGVIKGIIDFSLGRIGRL